MAGTSYTRQSSMSDGDTITAALFNNEFNQLLNAFAYASSSTTGHQHDGGAGEGGNIEIIGDQDFLNKIVVDGTNNRWGFFVEVSSSAVEQIRIQDGAIVPVTDNDIDFGTSSLEFKDAYFDGTVTTDTLAVDANATVGGTLGVTGALTGSSTLQGTTITATTAFVPDASDGAALGTTSLEFSDLYLADGAVIYLGDDQDINITHVADTGLTTNGTFQATTITATTAFVPDASDGAALGTSSLEFSDLYLADGAVVYFGDDQDVSLTHVADTGLLLSSTDQLQFGDSGTYIYQSADGVLDLVSDTEIELTATTIDINGAVAMDGAITGGTNITISGELDAATLDISGNADIDGTLEADAITVDGTALATYIRDTVGTNMLSSNTESGITVTYDTSNDNIDFAVDAAQTGITSLLATDIKIGEDDQTKIDFETADEIHFYAANVEQIYLGDNIFGPQSDSDVDLGSSSVRWKDAYVDSITVTGEVDGASLDISGNADIDGTLEADAITVDGTALNEYIADTVGAMVGSNTETNITVTYEDGDNTLDFVIGTLNQDTTGNAATFTASANNSTDETVYPVFVDGATGSQGAETDTGFTYNPSSGLLTISGELDAGSLDISGNADIDGTLEADAITVDGTTLAEYIADTAGAMVSSNTETGITVTYQDGDNTIDFALAAAQTTITSLLATDIKIGEDDQTKIDFETADTINFYAGNEKQLILTDGALTPGSNAIVDLGTDALEFKDAYFDGTVEADAISIGGTAITSTAAELNILDGVTATAAELNILDGVTSTAAELNILDGVTSTAAELNILDGVTSTATELNILDGVTATTAELNYLDITTLGTSAASKAVTADANGDVIISQEFRAVSYNETYVAPTSSSNATTIACESGNYFKHTLTENTTFTFSNPPSSGTGYSFILHLIQDSSARTVTWPGSVDWAAATAPTISTGNGDDDFFVFATSDGGTIWYGFTAGQAMA
jgi:cytoskeletal protein CcmA (bactofilin family)